MTPDEFAGHVAGSAGSARLIVGIVGAPGAGKSTLAARTAHALHPDAVVLPMDGFHLSQARLVELGRRDRMGAPDTFDVDALVATLTAIRFSGESVRAPGFDRAIEEAVPNAIPISPEKRVVLVEGNYLMYDAGGWERVAPLLDLTAFVAVDDALRHERLIARHIEFGKTPDAARAWASGPDEANARVITATAPRADLLVEGA